VEDTTHPEYALYFDGDGDPIAPSVSILPGCSDPDPRAPRRVGWTVISEPCFRDVYVPKILNAISRSGKSQVLLFVHGGLVSLTNARKRVDRLVRVGDASGTGALLESYYPIFINWQASLYTSYTDHLFRVRQGQRKTAAAIATSPYVLAKDLVFGAVRILPDTVELVSNRHGPSFSSRVCFQPPPPEYKLRDHDPVSPKEPPLDVRFGTDVRSPATRFLTSLKGVPWLPIKPVSTGVLIDGFGSESWKIMIRRTELMFHRELTDEDADNPDPRSLSSFLRRLMVTIRESHIKRVDFVAHSAGAIIMNRALREVPQLDLTDVVYMAAAASEEDYETTMFGDGTTVGYLAQHPHTNVYHLVLQPKAEINESYLGIFEAAPRGSLLYWIDNFLAEPEYLRQKTAGRAVNLAARICDTPPAVRSRVHVKAFDYGVALQKPPTGNEATPDALVHWYRWCRDHQPLCQPQTHGDFSEMPFWEDWFRETAIPGADSH
jgi:hypothetical protein